MKIAVYGTSGFTGGRVLRALQSQGVTTLSANRADFSLQDGDAVLRFAKASDVVVNCAGPFVETAGAFERAALAGGSRTVHMSCERQVMEATFARHADAVRADTVLCAAGGFSTVVAELAVWLGARTLGPLRMIEVAVAHHGGVPSAGTLRSYLGEVDEPIFERRDGALRPVEDFAAKSIVFAAPLSAQQTLPAPLPELSALTKTTGAADISARLAVASNDKRQRVFMRDRELLELLLAQAEKAPSARGAFAWNVAVGDTEGRRRTVSLHGQDSYALSAEICAFAAIALASTKLRGARTAFEVIDPQQGLALLARHGVRWSTGS